jgi:hypothetical protein
MSFINYRSNISFCTQPSSFLSHFSFTTVNVSISNKWGNEQKKSLIYIRSNKPNVPLQSFNAQTISLFLIGDRRMIILNKQTLHYSY